MATKRKRRKSKKREESGPVEVDSSEPVSVSVVRDAGAAPTVRPEAAIGEALGRRSTAPARQAAGVARARYSLKCPKCYARSTSFEGPGVCEVDGIALRVVGRVLVRG